MMFYFGLISFSLISQAAGASSFLRTTKQESNVTVHTGASVSGGSYCSSNMANINGVAKADSEGKSPDGYCYSHVADFIDETGYGGIDKNGFDTAIPSQYWTYAYQFAEYLNTGSNAADLCLENIQASLSNNPYNAPTGAIVVVRAGTPGTANPVAGDIAIADPDNFWNGGEMSYGGASNFPSSNDYVLGIFVPTSCPGSCGGSSRDDDDGGSCPSDCYNCVIYGGGVACGDKCALCSAACQNCIAGGGGAACGDLCQ